MTKKRDEKSEKNPRSPRDDSEEVGSELDPAWDNTDHASDSQLDDESSTDPFWETRGSDLDRISAADYSSGDLDDYTKRELEPDATLSEQEDEPMFQGLDELTGGDKEKPDLIIEERSGPIDWQGPAESWNTIDESAATGKKEHHYEDYPWLEIPHGSGEHEKIAKRRYVGKRHGTTKFLFMMLALLIIFGFLLYLLVPKKADRSMKDKYVPQATPSEEIQATSSEEIRDSEQESSVVHSSSAINESMRLKWRIDWKVEESLRQPDVLAIVYPKDINEQEIESKIDDIEEKRKHALERSLYSFEKRDLRDKILADMVMVVNQQQIKSKLDDVEEFRKIIGNSPLNDHEKKNKRDQILNQSIDTILLGQEGMKNFSATDREVEQGLRQFRKRLTNQSEFNKWVNNRYASENHFRRWLRLKIAGDKYLLDLKTNSMHVEEDKVRAHYKKNERFFEEPERVRIAQIFVNVPSTASERDRKSKRSKIEKIMARLRSRESFTRLAREYSEDGNGSKGGLMGVVKRGELPAQMDGEIFRLRSNQISPIMESKRGFHIFKGIKYYPHRVQPYEEVKERIEAQFIEKKFKAFLTTHISELRKNVEIKKKRPGLNYL